MGKLLNCSSRFMMLVMVLIFWFASALLMFLGIKMFTLVGSVQGAVTAKFVSIPALLLIFLSLICLVIGIIGCAGASFENRKVQGVFFCLLFFIFFFELLGFVLCIVYKDELKHNIEINLKSKTKDYGKDNTTTDSVDKLQSKFKCCGFDGPSDWKNTSWGKNNTGEVPWSCCNSTAYACTKGTPVPLVGGNYYSEGCEKKLYDYIKPWLAWLIALAVIFVLIEVLALSCTCVRMRHSKKVKYQTLGEEQSSHGYRA